MVPNVGCTRYGHRNGKEQWRVERCYTTSCARHEYTDDTCRMQGQTLLNSRSVCLQLLMDPLVLSVLYVWCQLNKDVIVSFWFGTQFKVSESSWPSKGEPLVAPNGRKGFTVSLMYFSFPRWVCQVSYLLHRCHHGAPETAYSCIFCTFLTELGYQLSLFPPGKRLFCMQKRSFNCSVFVEHNSNIRGHV